MNRIASPSLALLLASLALAGAAHAGTGTSKAASRAAAKRPAPAKPIAATDASAASLSATRTPPAATRAASAERPKSAAFDELLDKFAMITFVGRGNKMAHIFIEDVVRAPSTTAADVARYMRQSARKFKAPSGDGSIIVMFRDNSGAYIHPDGFVTPMGDDINAEVAREGWEELR